jgi:hypothetical protein
MVTISDPIVSTVSDWAARAIRMDIPRFDSRELLARGEELR